jgi:tRNA (adenine57-N1/adenine58-N1)-methyltransferase
MAELERGEVVVLVDNKGRRHPVRLTGTSEAIGRMGVVDTAALEGLQEGSVLSVGSAELVVIRPTVLDRVASIERKAQIVLPKDSALIALHADVKAGDLVVEGGAGSGALSIVLLHLLRPTGRLVTYEVREDHAANARANIERVGLSECHELKVADISEGIEEQDADSVILDIPEPWTVVSEADRALKAGGRFVSYSPTVAQVEQTHSALKGGAFHDVRTFETLERELVVGRQGTRPSFEMLGHTGYITAARKLS